MPFAQSDLLDSIVEEMGLVKGNAVSASGRVPAALFKAHMTGMDAADYMEFVQGKVAEYFEEDTCIDALQYAKMHEKEILEMDRYRKKRISWAFVPTDRLRLQERNWRLNPWKMKQVLRSLQIRIYTL